MSDPERCFICRGRAVYAVAVPVGEDAEFTHVYAVTVCTTCAVFHEVIAERVQDYLAEGQP